MLGSARFFLNYLRVTNPVFRLQPSVPILRSPIPGPAAQELGQAGSRPTLDYVRSIGNYAADADGNYFLDMDCAASPVGYHHPDLLYSALDPKLYQWMAQSQVVAINPDKNYPDLIRTSLMPLAPSRLRELALSPLPLQSAISTAVRKFQASHSVSAASIGVLSFGPGKVAFPRMKFPFATFEKENLRAEEQALKEVAAALKTGTYAAVVVEPITSRGNLLASPSFYLSLQDLCRSNDAVFIVDETKTAFSASGLFWAHEHWGPRASPDLLVFGGSMQASGFFAPHSFRPFTHPSAADLPALSILAALRKVVHSHRLQKNAEFVGKYLKTRLESVKALRNVRGQGLILAFDLTSGREAEELRAKMMKLGVILPRVEGSTLKLRPSLALDVKQAELFMSRLEFAVRSVEASGETPKVVSAA